MQVLGVLATVVFCIVLLSSLVLSWLSFLHICHDAGEHASGFAAILVIAMAPHAISFVIAMKHYFLKSVLRSNKYRPRNRRGTIVFYATLFVRTIVEVIGLCILVTIQFVSKESSAMIATSFSCAVSVVPLAVRFGYRAFQFCTPNLHAQNDDELVPLLRPGHNGIQEGAPEHPEPEHWECGCESDANRDFDERAETPQFSWWDALAIFLLMFGTILYFSFTTNSTVLITTLTTLGAICVSLTWPVGMDTSRIYDPVGDRYSACATQSVVSIGVLLLAVNVVPRITALPYNENDIWHEVSKFFTSPFDTNKDHGIFLLVNTIGSIVAYFTALTSCRLRMQLTAFVPAIVLAPLICIIVTSNNCWGPHPFDFLVIYCPTTKFSVELVAVEMGVFVCFWFSFLIAVRKIFAEQQKPLVMESDIFTRLGYSGILPLQWLAFNRRPVFEPEPVHGDGVRANFPNGFAAYAGKRLYVCATLYKESEHEMRQMLESVCNLARELNMNERLAVKIVFDHPFELNEDEQTVKHDDTYVLNAYGRQLKSILEEILKLRGDPESVITQITTDYGCQWHLHLTDVNGRPLRSKLDVYLKDPNQIKAKKRWSMGMYLSLIFDHDLRAVNPAIETNAGFRDIYVLTLDGDVKFEPVAVKTMIDKLEAHPHVGGVCGRIHPIGDKDTMNGLVGFQKFEYAVGHWLLKTTEDVYGSVLCLPGCFSLFRGCCINNCKDKFAHEAETGIDSLKFDMGEDRMLCTMMIENGSTLAYSPTAHAYTFCPEDFEELFKQRRRWMSSTTANITHLLANARVICEKSSSIGYPFLVLQGIMLYSSLISPSVVLMLILSSIGSTSLAVNLVIVAIPILYTTILLIDYFSPATRMRITGVFSLLSCTLMGVVLVKVAAQTILDIKSPGSLFFSGTAAILVVTAVLNWEAHLLFYGLVYFFGVPAAYLVLPLYSYANIIDMSWGTREDDLEKNVKADARNTSIQTHPNLHYAEAIHAGAGDWTPPDKLKTAHLSKIQREHKTKSKNDSLAKLRSQWLSTMFLANMLWIAIQLSVLGENDLRIFTDRLFVGQEHDYVNRTAERYVCSTNFTCNVCDYCCHDGCPNCTETNCKLCHDTRCPSAPMSEKGSSDLFSFIFLTLFSMLMAVQFIAGLIFAWKSKMEIIAYSGTEQRHAGAEAGT